MMKNPIFWQLLSVLLLGVAPRDSSARELARDVTTPGPTVNGTTGNNMIQGMNILTESITWLQDNMPSDKYFHGTIDNIREDILSLPIELALERYEMLRMLYMSKDRFNVTRTVLEEASKKLKSQCYVRIDIINNNDYSERLLYYTANNIVKYLNLFNNVLEVALIKLIEIQDSLSNLKLLLVDFNDTLSLKAEKINEKFEIKEHIFPIIGKEIAEVTFEIPADIYFSPGIIAKIKQLIIQHSQIIPKSDNEGNENTPVKIEKAMESISELLSRVDVIREYISNESDLITKHEYSLVASISDHEDISMEDIKYIFKYLKNVCSSYIRGALSEL